MDLKSVYEVFTNRILRIGADKLDLSGLQFLKKAETVTNE